VTTKKPAARPSRKAAASTKKKSTPAKTVARKTPPRRPAKRSTAPKFAAQTVVQALERDLAEVGALPKGSSSLVASAFALARELDAKNSATSKSMCARAFREALDRLRELVPAERERDAVDELADRRSRRRATAKVATN
jgi:hypothetical protein